MVISLVILHGWASDLTKWQAAKRLLTAAGFKVYLPSLPTDRIRNTADYSRWLKNYTKNLKSFYLLGHSFGGQIAIHFAAQHPRQLKKLILVNSGGIRHKFTWKRLIFWPLAKLGRWFFTDSMKHIFYRLLKETDYFQASPVMKQTLNLVIKDNQEENLTKISCPTLIIWGQNDKMTPLSDGRLIHRLIKGSQMTVLPDARHGLPFTHPQALVSLVVNFIQS